MKYLKSIFLASFALALFLPFLVQAQTWTELSTTGGITARSNSSSIYVPQRNEWVVFGGTSAQGRENDVWILDLNTSAWREVVPSNAAPAPRHTQNAVYDRANDRMIIFSGQGGGLFNDAWAFSFSDSSWTNLSVNGNAAGVPLQRYGGVTEWDSLNGQFVTFAGFTTSGRFEDTWTFNATTNTWTDVSGSVFPDKRCLFNSTLAHDRRQMIIYGGQGTGNFDDIWACDLDTYAWTELTPAVSPPGRHFSSVVYRGNGEVIIFGGNGFNQNNFAGALNDLWSFDLDAQAWTQLNAGGSLPPKRVGHVADFLPGQDKMIVFGGNMIGGQELGDVWVLDFNPPVGIEDVVAETPLTVYPNPAHEEIGIRFELEEAGALRFRVYDQSGNLVLQADRGDGFIGKHDHRMNVSTLSPGLYFLEVQGRRERAKFLKF